MSHGVSRLGQPAVQVVHAGVHAAQGAHVEQLLEVAHHALQAVASGAAQILWQ